MEAKYNAENTEWECLRRNAIVLKCSTVQKCQDWSTELCRKILGWVSTCACTVQYCREILYETEVGNEIYHENRFLLL
jgi:hypothetical protein